MKPLFEIGEACLLQSLSAPHLNGEVVIKGVQYMENVLIPNKAGAYMYAGFVYSIGVINLNGADLWIEDCLKKKQEPSQFSFNQLMSNLNTKIQERC